MTILTAAKSNSTNNLTMTLAIFVVAVTTGTLVFKTMIRSKVNKKDDEKTTQQQLWMQKEQIIQNLSDVIEKYRHDVIRLKNNNEYLKKEMMKIYNKYKGVNT